MRIGIVNDVALAREVLKRWVEGQPDCQLAWVADNGKRALELCRQDTPNLVLMDLLMPGMDGVECTRAIMKECPCAILVVTASVDKTSSKVFEAMGAGALDAVNTPTLKDLADDSHFAHKVNVIRRLLGLGSAAPMRLGSGPLGPLIAVGASSGGPAALSSLLRTLPATLPASLVVVQHIDAHFVAGLTEWLSEVTELKVGLARPGEVPLPGQVMFADRAQHLTIDPTGRFCYRAEPADVIHRPSVDQLFKSIASNWRATACGVLLTGMGRDGAHGLLRMRQRGFTTVAQDQASSLIYGMPKAAAECGAAQHVVPLAMLGEALYRWAVDGKL